MWWLWLACSFKVPDYLMDPYTVPHAECSQPDHIRAVGFDKEDSLMAQKNARRRLAESISSSLQSVQTSTTSVDQVGDQELSSSHYDAVSTVTTVFPYNHLIHEVEPVHRAIDGYRALACVQTSEIENAIVLKHQVAVQKMGILFDSMIAAEDVRSFSGTLLKYRQEMKALNSDLMLIQTLTEGTSLWAKDVALQQQTLEELSIAWRQRVPVFVTSNLGGSDVSSRLSALLQESQVRVESGSCTDSGYDVLLWSQQTTQKGPMGGHVANVSVMMRVTECGDANELMTVEIAKAQGYHSIKAQLANEAALDKVRLQDLPAVFETLLPL